MRAEGVAGPRVLSDGKFEDLRLGKSGELVVTGLHGKYYEQNYRGNLFAASASLSANVIMNSFTNTTINVLVLHNPPGSGKNLILIRTYLTLGTPPSTNQTAGAFVYVYATNATIGTTDDGSLAWGPLSCMLGRNNKSVAVVHGSAIPSSAIAILYPIASKMGATNPASTNKRLIDEPDGLIILTPGTTLGVQEVNADTGSNWTTSVTYIWEELPI